MSGGDEPASGEDARAQEPADEPSPSEDEATPDEESTELDPADALATASATSSIGPLDIHVMEVEVVGKLLRLVLWYQPGEQAGAQKYNVYELAGNSVIPSLYLLDPVNLMKYTVVRADDPLQSDGVYVKGSADAPLLMTHYYAAPPEDVESLQLVFGNTSWPSVDIPLR